MPEAEFARRLADAVQRRIRELVAQGVPRRHARQQAGKEFSVYDLIEVDHRGWFRFQGLDLSDRHPTSAPARSRRTRGSQGKNYRRRRRTLASKG